MLQLIGFGVVIILALYGALHLGWLPAEWAAKLPQANSIAAEMSDNIEMPYNAAEDPEQKPYADFAPDEKTFTERVTGEKNPNR